MSEYHKEYFRTRRMSCEIHPGRIITILQNHQSHETTQSKLQTLSSEI